MRGSVRRGAAGCSWTICRRWRFAGRNLARPGRTIRLKLLKIGALVSVSVRRIRFRLASGYPHPDLFRQVLANLRHGLSPG